ncbi:MAG: tRNA ((46)-N7)-methyltransferase TrmB [Bacteroidota bacterium]|nr:tRNA ((46)-N7)-methyltransferase TrmB [Bacteroidota bacterium]
MGIGKLVKYEALHSNPIVFEKAPVLKGKWYDFFKNQHPIILELACGKGDYTLGMARLFPDKNFIGVDIKGNRIWSSARITVLENLQNVAFIRDQIDKINEYFLPGDIEEIWITFSDPFPKNADHRRRLTSKKFLSVYKQVIKKGGLIHLKTDSDILYNYTKQVLADFPSVIFKDYDDVYGMDKNEELFGIQTYYEKMHLNESRTIKYLCFTLS